MESNFSEALTFLKPATSSAGGIVASQHKLASKVGAEVLNQGGNAVDAAIATAYAVSVLEPWMSGIGGGGHMVIHDAKKGEVSTVDFGMRSPKRLDPEDYPLSGEGTSNNLFPWPNVLDDRNALGATSIAVPGQVDGMRVALENFGTWKWEKLLQPAIVLAEKGMQIDWYTTLVIGSAVADLNRYPCASETYLEQGHPPSPAWTAVDDLKKPFPYLAKTLKHLAAAGPRDFYEGHLAKSIVQDVQKTGGILSLDDLNVYRAMIQKPLVSAYGNVNIHVHPELNAGVTLIGALKQISRKLTHPRSHFDDTFLVIVETLDRVYRQRLEVMGDIDGGRTMDCTTHLCVVDKQGNMVSLTQTLLSIFGSKLVLPKTGILMNNGLMWFNPEPGHPNSLEPDKRCLANTCPVIGLNKNGGFAPGASGGRRIMPAVLQLIHFLVDRGMSLEEAFHHPRIDHSGGDRVVLDWRISEEFKKTISRSFDTIETERTPFPLYFACPSAVMVQGDRNFGATEITHPWAEAIAQ